jgi:hypothetical protein
MNPEKFTLDLMDLMKRHGMLGNDAPQKITIRLVAPFDAHVKIEHGYVE